MAHVPTSMIEVEVDEGARFSFFTEVSKSSQVFNVSDSAIPH
jgi:hypothetical protein